jgi:hypothetical protein
MMIVAIKNKAVLSITFRAAACEIHSPRLWFAPSSRRLHRIQIKERYAWKKPSRALKTFFNPTTSPPLNNRTPGDCL